MAVFNGDNSSELILGTDFRDIIHGNGGSDEIRGFGGNDDLFGGTGGDDIFGGAGADNLYGNAGVNNLWGGGGFDWFIMDNRAAQASDDWIGDFQFDIDKVDVSEWGVSDFSQLKALLKTDGFGDAWLNAFYGGSNHYLTFNGVTAGELIGSDFIYSSSGALNQSGTNERDVMFGSSFGDTLSGVDGTDKLLGGGGDDALNGGAGLDMLVGGAGGDTLTGGLGKDTLTGNAGADIFDFNAVQESRGTARDTITDFQQGIDHIDVSGIDADDTLALDQAFAWIGNAAFTAAGQLHFSHSGGNTIISGNTDADAAAEFQLVIRGFITPHDTDFVL